jgi:putative hydrolase of the HAD superfamily
MPVLAIGAHAIHIPFHTTWEHEKIDHRIVHENFRQFDKAADIIPFLHSNL